MYRSDNVALVERRRALEAELEDVRRQESELRRRSLQVLDDIAVVSPCREPWRRMAVDARDPRIRHCARCRKEVYDLSSFDAIEVDVLIQRHGSDLCGRIHRRFDGTIVTADCPSPSDDPGIRYGRVLAAWFLILAALGLVRILSSKTLYGAIGSRDLEMERQMETGPAQRPQAIAPRARTAADAANTPRGPARMARDPASASVGVAREPG